jgi:hypothetical protein
MILFNHLFEYIESINNMFILKFKPLLNFENFNPLKKTDFRENIKI